MDIEDKVNECRKKKYFEVWFAFEALGVNKDVVETSMKDHIDKLSRIHDMFIFEKNVRSVEKVEKETLALPEELKNRIYEAWSQVVEIKAFVKRFSDLINIIYLFGPSAVEILGPDSKEIKIDEVQDVSNTIAGLMHQFASAGAGGIVITPK